MAQKFNFDSIIKDLCLVFVLNLLLVEKKLQKLHKSKYLFVVKLNSYGLIGSRLKLLYTSKVSLYSVLERLLTSKII